MTEPTCYVKWPTIAVYSPVSGHSAVVEWNQGETMEQALRREVREELGDALDIIDVKPWAFRDDIRVKTYAEGTTEEIYMIYLIFDCISANRDVTFNDEFQEIAWVYPESLRELDLNEATRITFAQKGLL